MANTITATITDLDGNAWAGGSYVISFHPSASVPQMAGQTVYSGALDSNGAFSVSLPTASWNFQITPNASQGGFSSIQAITTTASLSTILSALAVGPRFQAGPNAYGYADGEVILPVQVGQGYFNVTTQKQKVWNGSAWQTGGGGTSGTVTAVTIAAASNPAGSVATGTSTPVITLTTVPTTIYSAAGTPLPAATVPMTGRREMVSDATTPTYLGAYVSGGAVLAQVICTGTGWVTG